MIGVIMIKKFEEKGETFDEHRDTLKNLTDSYVGLSEIWDQSYTKLYKPWMDFMGESTVNLSGISMIATSDYKEFYDDWMNTYQKSVGKFSTTQVPIPRVTLEKVVMTTEESNKICMSWVTEFGENAKKTIEILNNGIDPAKYKEWFESMEKFSESMTKSSKELLDAFQESIDINLNLYKGWVSAMEKMSEKFKFLSKSNRVCRESTKIETIMKFNSVNRYAVPY